MSLAQFFGPYAELPIFILYRADKVPIDPNGDPVDAQLESNRMTLAEAELWVTMGAAAGVGVVILPELKLAFIDLDHARAGAGWQPHVINFLSRFPNAYRETSMSGDGVHMLFIYSGERPLHRSKNSDFRAECYTGGRYCALTGNGASGAVLTDCTEGLHSIIEQVFPPRDENEDAAGWTSAPVASWRGPTDDDALLAKAMQSASATAVFDGRASFKDLWTGNEAILARSFPSSTGGSWDGSSADLALFNHLSFWTGSDCARILRIAQREDCGLRRDKWVRVDNYLVPTILLAVADQTEWYVERHVTPAAAVVEVVPTGTTASIASGPPPPPGTLSFLPATQAPHVLTFDSKNKYEASLSNITMRLAAKEFVTLGFDTFFDRIMVGGPGGVGVHPITDDDVTRLCEAFERQNFAPIPANLMLRALTRVARDNSFDSAVVWLNSLKWDGVPRIDKFLATYCGAADDEYSEAVSRYIWTGLPARVFIPGCQLDMVVAFQSRQGKRKSSGLQALAPLPEYFTDSLSLTKDSPDFKRMIRGKIIVEIAELAGLNKAEVEFVKGMITRRVEEFVDKWDKFTTRYPRRCMLFASTNNKEFLPDDPTGQRRWAPVEIDQLNDVLIARDRDQLWAEGAARWHQLMNAGSVNGVDWRDAERLAAGRHAKHEQTDVWETKIAAWLEAELEVPGQGIISPAPKTRPFDTSEVLEGAIRLTTGQMDKRAANRAGSVLRQLGYERRTVRLPGVAKPVERWMPKRDV